MNNTIAAVATAYGVGGVSVIRISGGEAAKTADRIFKGKTPVSESRPYLMQYGKIVDFNGDTVDSVLCVYMRAPHSFTGEDTVEIHCHGGILVTQKILGLCLQAGARTAQPGEFTKRAFLNGKMDLSRAEAVADLIGAQTENAAFEAVNRMEGALSGKINAVRDSLLDITAQIMVVSDYPEEDITEMQRTSFREIISEKMKTLSELLETAELGRLVNEGLFCTIAGKPNTGKSSLLNALAGEERAIVTDIEGTTRDAITETVNIGGIAVKFCDTAGIREAEGIEEIGILKAYEYIKKSDVCLVVADSSNFTDEDRKIMSDVKGKKRIIALNKHDLADFDLESDAPVIKISAKTGEGIDELKKAIIAIAADGAVYSAQRGMIANTRQKEAVRNAYECLSGAAQTLDSGFPADLAAADIENAIAYLGEITGMTVSEEIIDKIFSKFCLGK